MVCGKHRWPYMSRGKLVKADALSCFSYLVALEVDRVALEDILAQEDIWLAVVRCLDIQGNLV